MFQVGVIGCGYWGPNLVRNFSQMSRTRMRKVADLNKERLVHVRRLFPTVQTSTSYTEIMEDPSIDIVAIATPINTHYELAKLALNKSKHVFVEKPLAGSSQQAEELISLASEQQKKLMVGHTFLYTSAVRKMKAIIDSGELGDLYYINAQRLNLGLFQKDYNVIWDLAPHDISIVIHLLGKEPLTVQSFGACHINPAIEDVATLALGFENDMIAFLQMSWLDPDKIRKMTVVGSKKMLVYDDIQPAEKIRIYDKRVEGPKYYDSFAEFQYSYKYGDIMIPKIDGGEPLQEELNHFIDCIEQDVTPLTDGDNGLKVIRIIEKAQDCLTNYRRATAKNG